MVPVIRPSWCRTDEDREWLGLPGMLSSQPQGDSRRV